MGKEDGLNWLCKLDSNYDCHLLEYVCHRSAAVRVMVNSSDR